MTSSARPARSGTYYIAPCVVNGELIGIEPVEVSALSSDWIDVCASLIEGLGAVFEEELQGPLRHVRIKYTSANGAALILVLIHGRPAVSGAFAGGLSEETDTEILSIFAQSARQSLRSCAPEGSNPTFGGLATLTERPLLVVIPYPDALLTDEEHEVARELMQHFAAAHMRHAQLA